MTAAAPVSFEAHPLAGCAPFWSALAAYLDLAAHCALSEALPHPRMRWRAAAWTSVAARDAADYAAAHGTAQYIAWFMRTTRAVDVWTLRSVAIAV